MDVNKTYGNRLRATNQQLYNIDPNRYAQFVNHAEQDVLGNIGIWIDKKRGSLPRNSVQGDIYMHVDRPTCTNCTAGFSSSHGTLGPLYLFSQDFPNVRIIITNSENNLIITVANGKIY